MYFSTWITVGLFVLLAMIYVLISGGYVETARSFAGPESLEYSPYHLKLRCVEIHTCMRVGVLLLEQGVAVLVDWASHLLYMKNSAADLLSESPWGRLEYSDRHHAVAAITISHHVARAVFLLPLLWLTLYFFRAMASRLLFLLCAFLALAGWPPLLLDGVFSVLRLTVNWPLAYYNFSVGVIPSYDFGSAGFICLLALYISRRQNKTFLEIAGMTLLGQLIFENNGIISGVAFFIDALFNPAYGPIARRRRLAFARLGLTAVVSASLASGFAILYLQTSPSPSSSANSLISVFINYFRDHWEYYGHYNFDWWKVTVANFLTLTLVPALVGLVIGAAGARIGGSYATRIADDLRGALAAIVGFCVTVTIGLFVSGLGAEMGRQILPLALMVLVAATRAGEALSSRKAITGIRKM